MTTTAATRRRRSRVATDGETVLLRLIPADTWATTAQVAAAAAVAGLPITLTSDPVMLGGKPFDNCLRALRRHGWALYDRHRTPHAWRRTPSGDAQLDRARARAVTVAAARSIAPASGPLSPQPPDTQTSRSGGH